MSNSANLHPLETITHCIHVLRGQKVLIDSDLAALYGVSTKRFNEQVKRNQDRFPVDFMFQLTEEEFSALTSQFATLKVGRGQHRKYLPYVFTEHGAIMASMILNSAYATEVSVYVVRAFIQLREISLSKRASRNYRSGITANPNIIMLIGSDKNLSCSSNGGSLSRKVRGNCSAAGYEPLRRGRVQASCHRVFTHCAVMISKKSTKFKFGYTSGTMWADHTKIDSLGIIPGRLQIQYRLG